MSRGECTPEERARCPRLRRGQECFVDKHHIDYPKNDYQTEIEKRHRGDPANQLDLPRCIHNAIHASGYVPEKPAPDVMREELACHGMPARAVAEQHRQFNIGRAVLEVELRADEGAA